jgi:serine/threonine protein kinase/Tfp pilus assembly protein PilF
MFQASFFTSGLSSCHGACPCIGRHPLTQPIERFTIRRMVVQAPAIGALLGHYRIIEQIGRGGMGVVFRACDEQLERDVAVKILPPGTFPDESARKRFRREARALGKLTHANVAMALDFGQQDGIDYLVTEYVSGITLDAAIAKGPMPQKTVIHLGIQLAKGLAAAHRAEIIHRDLKPGNLRLTNDGELKILDFGLARWREPVSEIAKTASLETQEAVAGTLPYMAPEQIRCEEVDARTDIWGAGAVLYEMATGERPFPITSSLKLIDAIFHSDPPSPSTLNRQIPRELDAIILKALDKDPDRRYQSAQELGVDLSRLLPAGSSGKLELREGAAVRKRSSIKWVIIGLIAMVCSYGGYRLRVERSNQRISRHSLLAVLPFDSSGQDEKTSALLLGLTETLTTRLAQTSGTRLQLISARDIREQGVRTADQSLREFGTDLVLEGSAHRVGDQIRFNCALVDSQTHRQLGARSITADTKDVFGLEDRVVSEIVSLLAADAGLSRNPAADMRSETNPEAYASYLRARGFLREYEKSENIELAIAELRNALALDSEYANAYAALGEAYLTGYQQANRGNDWIDQAQQNCQKSLTLRETAEGRICLGDIYDETGRYDLAVQQFQQAIQMDPSNEDGLRGKADAYVKLGKPDLAETAFKSAISLRPAYWGVYSWLGKFYYDQARYEEAITQFNKVVELAPGSYRGYSNLGAMYVAQGKYKEALGPLTQSIEIRPNLEAFNNLGNAYFGLRRFTDAADAFQRGLNLDDTDWLLWGNFGDAMFWSKASRSKANVAYEHAITRVGKKLEVNPRDAILLAFSADYNAMAGNHDKALAQIEQALGLSPKDGEVRLRAAIVFNQLGDTDRCLSSLERAVSLGYSPQVIRDTPDFDHLHRNARFGTLVRVNN